MIRLILAAIFLILYLILTIPLMLITWIIGRINPHAGDVSSLAIVNWGFRCLWHICGIHATVIGREKIPKDTPVLYIGNHRSIFDVVTCYPRVAGPTGFVSKIEVMKVPLLNIWMLLLHCLFLDRKNTRSGLDMILKAIELEKKGISVFIYPEGTRNKDIDGDELLPMHGGSFKIASKTDVPVVPICILGTEHILEAHIPFIHKSNIVIEYLDPVRIRDLSKEDQKNVGDYFRNLIQERYVANKAEYADYLAKYRK